MDTSKIIKGVVNSGRYTVTAPIVKEDYGLYLQIEGVELPSTYEVDFSNSEHSGTSVTMIGNSDGVLIPHQFIDTGKDIFAFLYHVGNNYGKTVYKFRIPNKCRPDRTEEEPTPEEQSVIDQAISALNTAVAQTAQDVIDADASAQNASADAERAESARDTAQGYANNAQTSATQASTSALQASASATASAQSASDAEMARQATTSLVAEAQRYANASEQSATASANSAEQAESAKGVAQSYAQDAQTSATYASMSESTASSKATEASGYADTASTKASESAQSASQALSYKTDAESAKTASQTAQGLAESARDSAISAKDDAESARDEAQNIVDGISAKAEQIDANTASVASLEEDRYKPYVVDSASGSIASFPDGADNLPLKSLVVNIDPVQDTSSGDPSPTNICPISGWTGCNAWHGGKNLLDSTLLKDQSAWNIITLHLTSNTLYVMSTDSDVSTLNVYFLKDGESQGGGTKVTASHPVVRLTGNDGILKIIQRRSSGSESFSNYHYQIEIGSTPTPYEPYQGQSIPINWQTEAGTVYGGKLDVLTGILTVYPYYDSYNGETLTGEWISDRDVYAVGTTPTIGAQVVNIGAEGTEYQLEPHEVASLLGQNNVFADTGDCAVEYRADTKLYIERLTAPDSADMIADANITSGQYFMVGNNLYKATANIANGAQIIVGTNATRVSLAQALNEINA